MSEGKTIKVYGDYQVTLDAKGAVLSCDVGPEAEMLMQFYPDTPEEARNLAGALNTIKRRMLQREHALRLTEEQPHEP